MIGVMAVDPGKRTGVAQGVFCADAGWTVRERVTEALERGTVASFEVVLDEGDERAAELNAAEVVARAWQEFVWNCNVGEWRLGSDGVAGSGSSVARFEPCACVLVVEEWTPRLPLKSASRDAMYPVRIAACLEGLLWGRVRSGVGGGLVYQQPSAAKRFCTDARLRDWGLWRKGSDHERDAYRHMALYLSGL